MMSRRMVCALALLLGCSEGGGSDGGTGGDSRPGGDGGSSGAGGTDGYADKELWLCRPDIEDDHCDTADLSMTEIRADGSRVVLDEVAPNPNAEVDCFYIYHTVNQSPEAGNTEILVPHPDNVIGAVFRNGAHYRGVCRMFAPLYHQMTISTYSVHWPNFEETEFFQRAYDDVAEAFEYYMRTHNEGRGFVLVGHSQGSHILTRLLQDRFDEDEELRAQLISAVLIGPTNRVQVLEGDVVGGSFANIPLCTSADETGCVIAFDANPAGVDTFYDVATIFSPPNARACVNPASLGGGSGTLAALMYPRIYDTLIPFPDGVATQWVRYPGIYTSRCSEDRGEVFVLFVDLAADYVGEVPITPHELQESLVKVWGSLKNLHSAEYFIANTDLVRIVEQQIAAWSSN